MFTLTQSFDDESEVEEAEEEYVEFFEAGKDSSEAFEPAEEPFYLVSLLVESAVKLLDVTSGKAVTLAKPKIALPISRSELSKFVGDYEISTQLSLKITASDEGLVVQASGQPPLPFSYEGEINGHSQFFTRAMDVQIEFMPTSTDHVSTLVLHLGGSAMQGRRE